MELEATLIVSQILAFLIMLWVLRRFAWRPLLKILQARREKIQAEFLDLEEQKQETAQLAEAYQARLNQVEEEARKKIGEAVEAGRQMAQKILEEAHTHARELLQKMRKEIDLEIKKAQAELKNQVVHMVVQVTQKMLETKLDSEKDMQMIETFIEKAQIK
jgi:F-type H+-transporting ATPase subunit b